MILLINTCSYELHKNEFVLPIKRIVEGLNFKTEIARDFKPAEKIIICGTALKDNEFLKHDFSWLKDFKKPVLGICAGMQVIAKVFNAKLYRETEIGMKRIRFLNKEIDVYELHNMAVLPSAEFEILGSSDRCVQAIKKDNLLGVMFHPEVRNEWIIEDFVKGKLL